MVPLYQAYLDDSGRASGPTYVIAGFLSTAKTWRWVAQKWMEVLDTPPILAYFKMKEAMNPGASKKHQSQFFGWPREAIDETIELFTELIWRTVSMRIRITVPNIEYGHIFKGKVGPHVDFPYWLAHVSAMMETTRLLAAHGIQEKVDFIFDTASEREQHWILNAWHFWKQNDWFEERKPLFGDPPIFRDDKTFLPLQAADLYAWHARKERGLRSEGREYEHPGWNAINEKIASKVERDWTEDDLRKQLKNADIIRNLNKWGSWSYEQSRKQRKR